jgi:hypothetical protein
MKVGLMPERMKNVFLFLSAHKVFNLMNQFPEVALKAFHGHATYQGTLKVFLYV